MDEEWPMFRGNIMRNGWYHYPVYYSFDVERRNEYMGTNDPSKKIGRPGEQVFFNFTILDETITKISHQNKKC